MLISNNKLTERGRERIDRGVLHQKMKKSESSSAINVKRKKDDEKSSFVENGMK